MFSADKICATISCGRGSIETLKQALRHEMLVTGSDAACDQLLIALEMDEMNVGTIANQDIAVAAFQSRACDNAARAQTTVAVDPSGDRVQPGPTIVVGERNTVVHLLDVCSRVKPIGVLELPSQARSEKCADGGFPRGPKLPSQRSPRDRAGQRLLSIITFKRPQVEPGHAMNDPQVRCPIFLSPRFLGSLIVLSTSVVGCLGVDPLLGRLFLCVASVRHAFVKIVDDLFCCSVFTTCGRIALHAQRISLVGQNSTLPCELGCDCHRASRCR